METYGDVARCAHGVDVGEARFRIIIADDHEVVRVGLRTILSHSDESYEVVGEASSGEELLKLLGKNGCDILIVDFLMNEQKASLDGIPLLRKIRQRHAKLTVVVMATFRDVAIMRSMYSEGAKAVVEKTSAKEILHALRAVKEGGIYTNHRLKGGAVCGDESPLEGQVVPALTVHEIEVVRMFVQGLSIAEIARNRCRSIKTVSRQKRSAMSKIGVKTDGRLFEYVRANDLL